MMMGRWIGNQMPKLASEMGALAVSKVNTPGLHFVGYITGLALQVKGSGAKSWILRCVVGGRRRDMGLGSYPSVGLAQARQKAAEARELIRQGVDPIERQRSALSALKASLASQLTFKETAKAYMSAHETTGKMPSMRNSGATHSKNTLTQLLATYLLGILKKNMSLLRSIQFGNPKTIQPQG